MDKLHWQIMALMGLLLLAVTACSGPPETQVYIVVTATPDSSTLTAGADVATEPPETEPAATTAGSGPIEVSASPAMPTPLVTQIQVAEQVFETGRMFWLQPTLEVWVMINDPDADNRGTWIIYDDIFVEGEEEIDPDLTPPADLIQPRRGFGKLWRQNENIREGVGWGVSPEYGFVTQYEYRAGGYLDSEGNYVPGPGVHIIKSLGNELFAFDEDGMTWRLLE